MTSLTRHLMPPNVLRIWMMFCGPGSLCLMISVINDGFLRFEVFRIRQQVNYALDSTFKLFY